jgi:hypothetical protein
MLGMTLTEKGTSTTTPIKGVKKGSYVLDICHTRQSNHYERRDSTIKVSLGGLIL